MLLTYFDEVKPQEHGQPYYWLGALMIAPEMLPTLEVELKSLAAACFVTRRPKPKRPNFTRLRHAGVRGRPTDLALVLTEQHMSIAPVLPHGICTTMALWVLNSRGLRISVLKVLRRFNRGRGSTVGRERTGVGYEALQRLTVPDARVSAGAAHVSCPAQNRVLAASRWRGGPRR